MTLDSGVPEEGHNADAMDDDKLDGGTSRVLLLK
jgi:hypothetical protein